MSYDVLFHDGSAHLALQLSARVLHWLSFRRSRVNLVPHYHNGHLLRSNIIRRSKRSGRYKKNIVPLKTRNDQGRAGARNAPDLWPVPTFCHTYCTVGNYISRIVDDNLTGSDDIALQRFSRQRPVALVRHSSPLLQQSSSCGLHQKSPHSTQNPDNSHDLSDSSIHTKKINSQLHWLPTLGFINKIGCQNKELWYMF